MLEQEVPNEICEEDKHSVRIQISKRSWIQTIQNKLISQTNLMSVQDFDDKPDTNVGTTPGMSERQSLARSVHGSSVFFKEDLGKSSISNFDSTNVKYRKQPHEVHFRIKIFIKYLIIRFAFTIFGPLLLTIRIINKDWLCFMKNFRMYGLNLRCILNYLRWISNYTILSAIIYYSNQHGFHKIIYEAVFFFMVYIGENTTFAIKYAFFHPTKINLLEKHDQKEVENLFEQSINPLIWARQLPDMVDQEIEQSIKRLQIESTSYKMYFMVQPNPERYEKIRINQFILRKKEKEEINYEDLGGDCVLMAKEIINHFNQKCNIPFAIKVSLFLTISRLTVYLVFIYYCPEYEIEIYLLVQMLLAQSFYFLVIFSIMMITYRDLKRKVFAMTQLSHLISCEKVEVYEEQKLFPTLNLLCIVSLLSWFNLRKMLLDYGLQYTRRQSFMLSFIMIVNSIMMLVMSVLFYLEIITTTSLLQATVDFGLIAFFSIALVLQGARINNHFVVHRGLLRKNLFLIQQISLYIFKKIDYTFIPQDPVFQAFMKILQQATVKNVIDENQHLNYSIFCIHSISNVYDDLEHQEKTKPFTVMGIAMTYELLVQVCLSALGLIGTSGLNFLLKLTQ